MLISAVGSLFPHQPVLLMWDVGDGQGWSEWGHSESAFITHSSYFRNKKEWNWNLCLKHLGCSWWQGCHQPWDEWEGWTHCQQKDGWAGIKQKGRKKRHEKKNPQKQPKHNCLQELHCSSNRFVLSVVLIGAFCNDSSFPQVSVSLRRIHARMTAGYSLKRGLVVWSKSQISKGSCWLLRATVCP